MTSEKFVPYVIKKEGYRHQALKAAEEMEELGVLLIRYANDSDLELDHIVEEACDVELMMRQVRQIFNITDLQLEQQIQYKIDRYCKGEDK